MSGSFSTCQPPRVRSPSRESRSAHRPQPFQVSDQVAKQARLQFDSAVRAKIAQMRGKKGFQMKRRETASQKDSEQTRILRDGRLETFKRVNQSHRRPVPDTCS
jgi:hypothetical protein